MRSVALLAAFGLASAALLGYGAANLYGGGSLEISAVPWGLLVPGYMFFAHVATGSVIVTSLYTVFGYAGPGRGFERVVKYGVWFSLATIVLAWVLIIADLTRPWHAPWLLLGFNPASRIAWMALLYLLFALALVAKLVYVVRSEVSEALRAAKGLGLVIALAAIVAAVAIDGNLGQAFGAVRAVPRRYGPHLASYFVVSAVLVGAAGQVLYVAAVLRARGQLGELRGSLTGLFPKLYLVGVPTLAFLMVWNALTAWYEPEAWEAYREMIAGGHAAQFWAAEVLLGVAVPLALAVHAYRRGSLASCLAASVALLVAGFSSKYSLVVYGQAARLESAGLETLIGAAYAATGYHPAAPEVALLAGAFLAWPALLLLGTVLLPLASGEKPRRLFVFK